MPAASTFQRMTAAVERHAPTAATYKRMNANQDALARLANGVPVRLGCGPLDRAACLHYFTEGDGMKVYAWLDGAAWGVEPVVYHIQGGAIVGPTSRLPRRKK